MSIPVENIRIHGRQHLLGAMTDVEIRVYGMIERRDREDPIKDHEIASALNMAIRDVADVCKSLIENHRIPIGAAKEKPFGRYIIQTEEELNRYLKMLYATQVSIYKRMKCLKMAYETYHEERQLRLI